ncbi:DUF4873 domain-containing protein [Mycobacterium sp. CBMA271]|uniref:DUF4873 domain-containing protein n=1 Tax=unclassified Mycobacteroides TaxID=2618759 RepID=UPI0012DEE53D|nr:MULTISPECIES: DUF4873 domain-containing protein [unclassified Mycobacteroides]MUM17863.1 DUF4873 domain-containing protein [Mycobacteroides sp. CBMA 326]MUM20434.1 DUF4873 domain-containing protein [Mycobacteroides sp. CBMA 271]
MGDRTADRHDELDYCGTATLVIDGAGADTHVELRGLFQPIDGTFRWYGRTTSASAGLAELVGARAEGLICTQHGRAPVTVDEVDLWGRYRMRGTGRPPFPIAMTLDDLE